MKTRNLAVSLLAKYTCKVSYLPTGKRVQTNKPSLTKAYTFASTFPVKENDIVIVNTFGSYSLGQVLHVDDSIDLDLESDIDYQFLLCKADLSIEPKITSKLNRIQKEINNRRTLSARDQALALLGITAADVQSLTDDSLSDTNDNLIETAPVTPSVPVNKFDDIPF